METLNPNKIGLSLSLTFGALYILCFVLFAVIPKEWVIALANSLMHGIDVSTIVTQTKSIGSVILGLISWLFIGFASGYIFSMVYNKIVKNR